MNRGTRAALVAAACGALVGIPALARAQQQDPATGEVVAKDVGMSDGRYSVNGTDATTLTIATGGTVKFDYPSGATVHNVDFDNAAPSSCAQTAGRNLGGVPPLPTYPLSPGWEGTCTFATAGTYAFHCDAHPNMRGTIVVRDRTTPTPTPTATPGPGATPTPTATPVVTPVQSTLNGAVRLARRQTGTRVRGSVQVKAARSRLEVALWAPRAALSGGRSAKPVRVGRWVRASTKAGRVAFSVRLATQARNALRRRHRLAVTVTVALTPPGGHRLTRRLHVTLRAG